MTTEEILNDLRFPDAVPKEALDEVLQRRDEFVPLLVASIENAVRSAEESDPDDCLPAFGLYLLAQFREAAAFETVLTVFELEEGAQEEIFGTVVMDDGPRFLACVAGENPDLLKECVRRKSLRDETRWAALDALVLQVAWGERPAETVELFFKELFETDAFADAPGLRSFLVCACLDLEPAVFLDHIRKLFERDLIDTMIVGDLEAVENEALEDRETRSRRKREVSQPIIDTADEVAGWPLFQPIDEGDFEADPDLPPAVPIRVEPKIGRNELCPCGSGKKYKKCCLRPGG